MIGTIWKTKDDVAPSTGMEEISGLWTTETPSRFTTMLIGDVFDQMIINRDGVGDGIKSMGNL